MKRPRFQEEIGKKPSAFGGLPSFDLPEMDQAVNPFSHSFGQPLRQKVPQTSGGIEKSVQNWLAFRRAWFSLSQGGPRLFREGIFEPPGSSGYKIQEPFAAMNPEAIHISIITLALAYAAGALAIMLARRLGVSAIAPLALAALVLGPEGLGWIQPEVLGGGLRVIASLLIALMLFEGGLTLFPEGYRRASALILKLLSIGVLVSWAGAALAIQFIFHFPIAHCLLYSSLILIAGPAALSSLLRRIRLEPKIHNILYWEGSLIDPIGIFLALLCYEWLAGGAPGAGGAAGMTKAAGAAGLLPLLRIITGLSLGIAGGWALAFLLKKKVIPSDEALNREAIGFGVLIYAISEAWAPESGLLCAAVCGLVAGSLRSSGTERPHRFKSELTELLIGMLFLLLAARLRLADFREFGSRGAILIAVVLWIVRPLNILLSSWGLKFSWREKLFLSWVTPRGVIAASLASIMALNLSANASSANWRFLETFVYGIIIASAAIQGLTAGPLAKWLGLQRPAAQGWLIIGSNPFAMRIAQFLSSESSAAVVLLDTNPKAVEEARAKGFAAFCLDARSPSIIQENPELDGMGFLLAITDNQDLNALICQRWARALGRDHVFFWGNKSLEKASGEPIGRAVWSDLPKPSIILERLAKGEARWVETQDPPASEHAMPGRLLLLRKGNEIVLDPAAPLKGLTFGGQSLLYLRLQEEDLLQALKPEFIMWTQARSPEQLFRQLIHLARLSVPELPIEETVQSLLEREKAAPTYIGRGLAVPHATSPKLKRRLCLLARDPQGVDFGAGNNESVRLAFMLLSPADDPKGHLRILAQIAQLAGNPITSEQLLAASSPQHLLEVIRKTIHPS